MKVLKQRKILKKITQWLTQERNMKLREWDKKVKRENMVRSVAMPIEDLQKA